MRATYIGPPLSEIISHAAPTVCMKAPMSETTFATSRLRKVVDFRGRQKLVDSGKIVLFKPFRSVWAIPDLKTPRLELIASERCPLRVRRTPAVTAPGYSSRWVRTRLRAHPMVCRRQEATAYHPGRPAPPPHRRGRKQSANEYRQQAAARYPAMRFPRSALRADRRHRRNFLSRRIHKQKR